MEITVNGTTLYCETIGEGEPCLCLHGGPGTDSSGLVRSLAPVGEALGLRMIFYDHRGHGRSEWVDVTQCTQDQLVADIEGVRQALGLGPALALGISWGGFLGLMYAARYPRSVRALAVVGAAASRDFMARAEENARRGGTPEQYAAYRSLWDGSLTGDESFRQAFDIIRPLYLHDQRLAAASIAMRGDTRYRLAVRTFIIEHEYARYDCRGELGRIACPVLVAVGRHDWICPVDQAEEIHRLVPHGTLRVFESSGHSPHVEEREAFVTALGATFRSSAPP